MANLKNIKPFKILGPGDQIKEQMELFNWTQEDLASILDISPKHLNSILQNKQSISFDIAKQLSKTFGHSTQFWINLDTEYRLKLESGVLDISGTSIKAMIYKYMPVTEMIKRQWIDKPNNAEDLYSEMKKFWGVEYISEEFLQSKNQEFKMRKSEAYSTFNINYVSAWLQKAKNLSGNLKAVQFYHNKLDELACNIGEYTVRKNGVELFLNDLKKTGVQFVYLKHLPKTYLDGAAFYYGDNPVIAFTARYNRIDHFWFTIAHEIGHILKHLKKDDIGYIDDEKLKQNSKLEKEADTFAAKILKHNEIYSYFANNIKYITSEKIESCSKYLNVHKAIIVGALAFRKTLSYKYLHKYTEPIEDILQSVSHTKLLTYL
jgi:HTH-type transcriptional regulator / antitoxin HigA